MRFQNVVHFLCIFKIDGDIKHLNSFVHLKKTGIWTNSHISVNFKVKKMVDHILEIPRLAVLNV